MSIKVSQTNSRLESTRGEPSILIQDLGLRGEPSICDITGGEDSTTPRPYQKKIKWPLNEKREAYMFVCMNLRDKNW